ncbi:MAG: uroporphyrinogen-III synthase [Pseudomonadales bacterium]|jgi:uroporphyrinogen-III synthase|nr:uroporphyrinogen-III synthase [Pseudomonadales bacterium]MDP6469872.1 uroporphyrinogen-III synthase [Pseudomonadales bacterium]MDP6827525.1 uroporphyrinogen-III synthase [Pseudomonadales bacterium]MDP6971342.1 uroporphyrinogen-III synthase [Pseudomonadales bacterium]
MVIWVTRSEPGASRLGEALESAGFDVVRAPVVGVQSLAVDVPEGSFDILIVLSEHAAGLAKELADRAGTVLAIGERTREALSGDDVDASIPEQASSEGLLDHLDSLGVELATQRAVIVRGEGGREVLAAELRRRGADVTEVIGYRRIPLDVAIQAEEIDTIIASSGDGIRQAGRVWFSASGDPGVLVIVPSVRVGEIASQVGFQHIVAGEGADTAAVLSSLQSR